MYLNAPIRVQLEFALLILNIAWVLSDLSELSKYTNLIAEVTNCGLHKRAMSSHSMLCLCMALLMLLPVNYTVYAQRLHLGIVNDVVHGETMCNNRCNGHGVCISNGDGAKCNCDFGWGSQWDVTDVKSPSCAFRTCPSGNSWANPSNPGPSTSWDSGYAHGIRECSNIGNCNRQTGHCECPSGFHGESCQRRSCFNDCSGHGDCLNMRRLARINNAFPLAPHYVSYAPTESPTSITNAPTHAPTESPTEAPTEAPTAAPSEGEPSFAPTESPTEAPTTSLPTYLPTMAPSHEMYGEFYADGFNFTKRFRDTWDAEMIFGCNCHSSWPVGLNQGETQVAEWFGPDCSLRRCPSADDPDTTTVDETDCEGVSISGTGGVGRSGNKCHVDCANRGVCDYQLGACSCFEGYYGLDCTMKSVLSKGTRADGKVVTNDDSVKFKVPRRRIPDSMGRGKDDNGKYFNDDLSKDL